MKEYGIFRKLLHWEALDDGVGVGVDDDKIPAGVEVDDHEAAVRGEAVAVTKLASCTTARTDLLRQGG